MPPTLRDWLGEDHVVWFVLDAVEKMDLSEFYGAYCADGHGRTAHDPAMMVALLLYSYAGRVAVLAGESSGAARKDVLARMICANRTRDHTTIRGAI